MRIAYTDDQIALRDELRDVLQGARHPRGRRGDGARRDRGAALHGGGRADGQDGWLGVGWPKEYGGRGFGPMEQFVFYDEAQRAGAPVPFLSINTVGPAIMQFGIGGDEE